MSLSRTAFIIVLGLAGLTVGCGRPFDVRTPSGFVELGEQPPAYDYRATTAEGVVVAVRALDVEDRGTLAFWEEAVTLRLRGESGYALLAKSDVRSEDGTPGRRLRFGNDRDGKPYTYLVTLFRAQDRLFVLEAGGRREHIARYEPALEWQAKTFHARCGFFLAPVFASRTCNRW
jgi:hypothetical protein